MPIQASVVVPTFRRPELLSRCLTALMSQTFDPTAYEVIVADGADSPELRRLVEAWAVESSARGPAPALRYVGVKGARGPAAARNSGWREAVGEIVAFTDDDCIPAPDWLRAGVAAFGEGVAGAWGTLIKPSSDPAGRAATLEGAEFVTSNCFCKWGALAAVRGFDARFTNAWREDSDLFFSLIELGGRVLHAPDAVVVHPAHGSRWGHTLSRQKRNAYNALLFKKHRALYRTRIETRPPWRFYGIAGSLLAALAAAGRGRRWLALGSAGAWAWMTAAYCAERLRSAPAARRRAAAVLASSAVIPPLAVFWRLWGAVKYRVLFL